MKLHPSRVRAIGVEVIDRLRAAGHSAVDYDLTVLNAAVLGQTADGRWYLAVEVPEFWVIAEQCREDE